jgi:hypothetical protein
MQPNIDRVPPRAEKRQPAELCWNNCGIGSHPAAESEHSAR